MSAYDELDLAALSLFVSDGRRSVVDTYYDLRVSIETAYAIHKRLENRELIRKISHGFSIRTEAGRQFLEAAEQGLGA